MDRKIKIHVLKNPHIHMAHAKEVGIIATQVIIKAKELINFQAEDYDDTDILIDFYKKLSFALSEKCHGFINRKNVKQFPTDQLAQKLVDTKIIKKHEGKIECKDGLDLYEVLEQFIQEQFIQKDHVSESIASVDACCTIFSCDKIVYDNQILNHPELVKEAVKIKRLDDLIELGEDKELARLIAEAVEQYGAKHVIDILFINNSLPEDDVIEKIITFSFMLQNLIEVIGNSYNKYFGLPSKYFDFDHGDDFGGDDYYNTIFEENNEKNDSILISCVGENISSLEI